MTPQQLAELVKTGQISPDQLNAMDHALLYSARRFAPQEAQSTLAEPEHRAFAREATEENLSMALPIAVGSVLYPAYKALSPGRSPASLGQVTGGLKGVGEGIGRGVSNRLAALLKRY